VSTAIAAAQVGVYRPPTVDERGRRVPAWDEDSTTLAVEAARLVVPEDGDLRAVTVVTRSPTYLVDDAPVVITKALRLGDVELTQIHGGGAAALAALAAAATPGVVVAVETEGAVGAAAVFVGSDGARPSVVARHRHSVPYRVRRAAAATASVYDDDRLVRERAWRPAVEALCAGEPAVVTGIPAGAAARLGAAAVPELADGLESSWAALAATARGGRVVAIEGASGVAVECGGNGGAPVATDGREAYPAPAIVPGAPIALSLAAYERAFDAKVGLVAARCACGTTHFPPRVFCPGCGERDRSVSISLSHRAAVYSMATVRVPIPGMPREYSLAVVDVEGSDVRALVHVTGGPAGAVAIGDPGQLVLRRVAEREGVPDYGYAFLRDPA
jgi:uncharacterized OB-fold protein